MNRTEATSILRQHLDNLEALGYSALVARLGQDEAFERTGESGVAYQLEISILWDYQPKGAIRILGSIDDGGLRAFVPLTDSRLVGPQIPAAPTRAEPRNRGAD